MKKVNNFMLFFNTWFVVFSNVYTIVALTAIHDVFVVSLDPKETPKLSFGSRAVKVWGPLVKSIICPLRCFRFNMLSQIRFWTYRKWVDLFTVDTFLKAACVCYLIHDLSVYFQIFLRVAEETGVDAETEQQDESRHRQQPSSGQRTERQQPEEPETGMHIHRQRHMVCIHTTQSFHVQSVCCFSSNCDCLFP